MVAVHQTGQLLYTDFGSVWHKVKSQSNPYLEESNKCLSTLQVLALISSHHLKLHDVSREDQTHKTCAYKVLLLPVIYSLVTPSSGL